MSNAGSDLDFLVEIKKTHLKEGLFNVPVSHEAHFGGHGDKVEIGLDNCPIAIVDINRTANSNGTPRIRVGGQLQDWFKKENLELGDHFQVQVISPHRILIRRV